MKIILCDNADKIEKPSLLKIICISIMIILSCLMLLTSCVLWVRAPYNQKSENGGYHHDNGRHRGGNQ